MRSRWLEAKDSERISVTVKQSARPLNRKRFEATHDVRFISLISLFSRARSARDENWITLVNQRIKSSLRRKLVASAVFRLDSQMEIHWFAVLFRRHWKSLAIYCTIIFVSREIDKLPLFNDVDMWVVFYRIPFPKIVRGPDTSLPFMTYIPTREQLEHSARDKRKKELRTHRRANESEKDLGQTVHCACLLILLLMMLKLEHEFYFYSNIAPMHHFAVAIVSGISELFLLRNEMEIRWMVEIPLGGKLLF